MMKFQQTLLNNYNERDNDPIIQLKIIVYRNFSVVKDLYPLSCSLSTNQLKKI